MSDPTRQFADLVAAIDRRRETHRLEYYEPYSYQMAFHNAIGYMEKKPASQRALICGNQVGKTFCGAMEVAIHTTGLYPKWWKGHRFSRGISCLVGGLTNESVRDLCQKELFGDPVDEKKMGTGSIPINLIGKTIRKAGVPNALDSVQIKHVSGLWSKIAFRAYEQGAKKHMGSRIDLGWLDEEPPEDIWGQYIRGTLSTKGMLFITFTPEEGVTKVVYGFLNELKPGQAVVRATWDDAPHMNHDRREQLLMAIPAHQREMRSKGVPLRGTGIVYQVPEEQITCDPVEIPSYWPRLCAVDFGILHGFAAIWMAWDRDRDIFYVYDCYRVEGEKMSEHVSQLNRRGKWIKVMWPSDGLNREKSSGKPLAELYREEGANMWHEPFSNPPSPGVEEGKGGNSVEYGIEDILHRMNTGRFKVFKNLQVWFSEWREYHRDDGKIVKQYDDLMDATRYCGMSMRHATTETFRVKTSLPFLGASNWR